MAINAGSCALVRYNVGGPLIWHVRIIVQVNPASQHLFFPKQLLAVGVLAVLVRARGEVAGKRPAVPRPFFCAQAQ